MKTLNELTPKERIELYKKALVDWKERPFDNDAYTKSGLCYYFESMHKIDASISYVKEWDVHVRQQIKKNGRTIFLSAEGLPSTRIAALNAMIKELEEAQ